MTLRQQLAKVVVEALVRAACWLMRAEELPPLPAGAELKVVRPAPPARLEGRKRLVSGVSSPAHGEQLERLACVDGLLAEALKWKPERRWKQ